MKVVGIIPARMASARFPGKPLVDIGGKSMIQRVYERALLVNAFSKVIVATDHEAIYAAVQAFGGEVVMTSAHHLNGTERCAEVIDGLKESYDIVVNIQGDEPFFEVDSIENLLSCFKDDAAEIASLAKRISNAADIINPTVVKVVFDEENSALYFSRAPIPFHRETKNAYYFKHIGIYAFKADVLKKIVQLKTTRLEELEKLEQLRWLENGYKISLGFTAHDSNSVDTPEDLVALKEQFNIRDI